MTKQKPEIRAMRSEDVATVAVYESEIAKISFPDDPVTDLAFYKKKMNGYLKDGRAAPFVAVVGTDIVGYACVSRRQNFVTKEVYADFQSIFVDPSQRGTGLVGMLVDCVFNWCRDNNLMRVVFRTRADNEAMKTVLVRSGFKPAQIFYETKLGHSD